MMRDTEARLIKVSEEGFAQREREDISWTEVRSTVESQFQQMEQAHDRIRAQELGARLGEHND
jgi:hypothetical protein